MNYLSLKQDSLVIVYDADCIQQPGAHLFDPAHWEQQQMLEGSAPGRGSALFLKTGFGPAVLRRYLRGGWAANVSRDRYVFTGFERSRPIAEFNILARLKGLDLPVPRPLAALCERDGCSYTGSLLTRRIENSLPLADLLSSAAQDLGIWGRVGACIRRFHEAGVVHADLNARNILVGSNAQAYLLDFDRARIMPGAKRLFQGNLARLHRSLKKLWPVATSAEMADCWQGLLDAYRAGAGSPEV
jgi:3-deoxy-D-manno-octulosonic acid kinase